MASALVLLLGAGAGVVGAAPGVPDVSDGAVVEAFVDGAVKAQMRAHHSPSGVVAVMKDGELVFAKGYGYIDVERRISVDPATSLFRPGSISKLFTWVSVMQLVEQGRLDLDVDVNRYLETFQVADTWPGQPVTLRHILTHTAGFEDGALGFLIVHDQARILPLNESLAKYQPERVYAPGEQVAYSNWATALAGLIVANVSGENFNDYVQRHIFDVLGMTHSSFVEPLPPALDAHMAKSYTHRQGRYEELPYELVSNVGPAGAAAVSAGDMSLFARALLNGGAYRGQRILAPETLRQMLDEGFSHDPRVRGVGLGFIKYAYGPDGLDVFGHGGATGVFKSHFGLSRAENFMLFLSFSGPGAGAVRDNLLKAFYDEFFPRPSPAIEPPADFAERSGQYVGNYVTSRSAHSTFEALLRLVSGTSVEALPGNTLMIAGTPYVEVGDKLFREVDGVERVAFQAGEDGDISGYVLDGTQVMRFYRAPFWETRGFTTGLLAAAGLAAALVLLRLAYQWRRYRTLPAPARRAETASIALAVPTLLFLVFSALGLSAELHELLNAIPLTLKLAMVCAILAGLAALYHAWQSLAVWRDGLFEGTWPRLRHSLLSVVGLAMLWFYSYWNLLGFYYYD
ncbi:serine hydrolase domain-containing protein [Parahaliea mediterranea]|nr:beta-lactamase family protein [Parahaliea mediterranea]